MQLTWKRRGKYTDTSGCPKERQKRRKRTKRIFIILSEWAS